MANQILLLNQAGIESVRGTPVPATRIVYADITPDIQRALNHGINRSGTFTSRRRPHYSRTRPNFAAVDEATFEDLAWWMELAIKGGVTGAGDAGSPEAFTYEYIPSLSTDDLDSITLEWNEAGNPIESSQLMIDSWTLRGDPDNDNESAWMFDAQLMGRDVTTGITYTPAIPQRDTEVILARGTKFYVDGTAANVGMTQVTGKLINWSISGNNNLHFKAFAEDERYFAANKVGRGERTYDTQLTFEFEDPDEFDNFLSSDPVFRAIRLERDGSIIHDAVRNRLRTDIFGYWSTFQRGNRETNLTATMTLQHFLDADATTDFRAEVVNDLSVLP